MKKIMFCLLLTTVFVGWDQVLGRPAYVAVQQAEILYGSYVQVPYNEFCQVQREDIRCMFTK